MYPFSKLYVRLFKLISDLKISGQDHIPQKVHWYLWQITRASLTPWVLIAVHSPQDYISRGIIYF